MGKTIIKKNDDGTFDAEHKSTAVLITELIATFPNMCEAEIRHALEDIRESAEQDGRIRKDYATILRSMNQRKKGTRNEGI